MVYRRTETPGVKLRGWGAGMPALGMGLVLATGTLAAPAQAADPDAPLPAAGLNPSTVGYYASPPPGLTSR